jgi:hypothetical protein
MTGATAGRKPSFLAFFRLGSSNDEGTHLRAIFLSPFFHYLHTVRNLLDGHARVESLGAARRGQARGRRSGGGRGIENW